MMSWRPGAVDLRSDQITKPTPGMREAMASADVGNDIYGEDPTVNALEARVATLLGKEAAVFVPSGTMANQIAIGLHTRPGDSVLTEKGAHCFVYESGAAAAINGVQFEMVPAGLLGDQVAWQEAVKPESIVSATTSLVVVENSFNGRATSVEQMDQIVGLADSYGLPVHVDGARLWNAAVALGVEEKALVAKAKTVAVCFSKSLGAPMGSALAGPKPLIDRARKLKKRLGGGMCQAGVVAAAALYALDEDYRQILETDRARLKRLQDQLLFLRDTKEIPLEIKACDPHSNICFFRVEGREGAQLEQAFADAGVLIHHMSDGYMRIVTHRDLSDSDIEKTMGVLTTVICR